MGVMREIDRWLNSEESGEAFSNCVRCRFPLLEIAAPWLVNKEFHRSECVLEYAICQPCRDSVTAEISEESKKAVRHFLETEIDWEGRIQEFAMSTDPADLLQSCVACKQVRIACEGFGVSALFDSEGNLVTGPLPLMICSGCMSRVSGMLSDHSKAVWRRFLAEHFDGPPNDASESPGGGMSGLF